jgi:hypothetical protein
MNNHDVIDPPDKNAVIRVTTISVEITPEGEQRQTRSEAVSPGTSKWPDGSALTPIPTLPPRMNHNSIGGWSPLRPFAGLVSTYRLVHRALGRDGKLGVLYICLAAGLASILWRQYTVPIGIGGGLLVSGMLFVRTGAYREYLAAIENTHGVPPLDVVLRYNVDCLAQRIRVLWRRH